MTLREAIGTGADRIAGREDVRGDARRDAELLLLHVLGARRTVLFTDAERQLTAEQAVAYDAAAGRRAAGEPMQYITGRQEFFGLSLRVTPAVLIPRPETEVLVEAVLARLPAGARAAGPVRVADVGTGSGAIAVAIAHQRPLAEVTALDLSGGALEVARANAIEHGVEQRVRFLRSDLLEAVAGEAAFDAIVSNPPYVALADRDSLHSQVREHEPALALFAGEDGLAVYRRLIPQAFERLKPGGLLALEIGYGQRSAVADLLGGWNAVEFVDDLQGIARVALALRALSGPALADAHSETDGRGPVEGPGKPLRVRNAGISPLGRADPPQRTSFVRRVDQRGFGRDDVLPTCIRRAAGPRPARPREAIHSTRVSCATKRVS